ncbi:MAG: hypothetical protein CSB01_02195 [Bacteroidia bacterium]|nr:MAG: hypothetical protein CSB01_02195 [Bacteroidia bacterium]
MQAQNPLLYTIKSALLGVAIGDALGVPFEFIPKEIMLKDKATKMVGGGSHGMPIGTFSDDSSLTFCLAEALTHGFNLDKIGENFIRWYMFGFWTAYGEVFDIGETVRRSIHRLNNGCSPELAGGADELDNGNGALMRILPLLFYIKEKSIEERFLITQKVASITHRHIRSTIACFYYLEFAKQILEGKRLLEIYHNLQTLISSFLIEKGIDIKEIAVYNHLLKGKIYKLPESEITAECYVVETLEASIWSLLTTNNYKEATLQAVNLGDDTDTTAAVTGGLAGLYYGFEGIPNDWVAQIVKRKDIENLAERLTNKLLKDE